LQALISAPVLLYLGTLTVMLFRPPDLEFHSVDRIAFGLLVFTVGLRAMALRRTWWPSGLILWPMAGLVLLVVGDLLARPFEVQMWSVAVAKFFVPYSMFYLAGLVFCDGRARKQLEIFALVVLGYLVYLALASLAHLDALVFPKFILDSGLGLNAMRARGPFLQPVANGAALNCLGLIALDAYGRGRLSGVGAFFLIGGLPLAILATLTRSVWLGFGTTMILLWRWSADWRVRRVCWGFLIAGILAVIVSTGGRTQDTAGGRLRDGETVDFRMAAYEAGWTMFEERPILGWGSSRVQTELADRIDGFHGNTFAVHNTYFEILLAYGLVGVALYLWLVLSLVRLGRKTAALKHEETEACGGFLAGSRGRTLWLLLLVAYFANATFVVMNYQFVNGLLFTIAGIVSYQSQAHQGQMSQEWRESLCEGQWRA
jgi:O-antigen ligase